jgi:hypothetical protein
LSKINVSYLKSEVENFDYVLYEIADGDISKIGLIEGTIATLVSDWYYVKKINDLNKMKTDLEQLKAMNKN